MPALWGRVVVTNWTQFIIDQSSSQREVDWWLNKTRQLCNATSRRIYTDTWIVETWCVRCPSSVRPSRNTKRLHHTGFITLINNARAKSPRSLYRSSMQWQLRITRSRLRPILHLSNTVHWSLAWQCLKTVFWCHCIRNHNNKKAVLSQGNRAMPQLFFSV